MKPISSTAFYCCGVRMQDAENKESLCQDIYAKDFMDERGLRIFSAFKSEKIPTPEMLPGIGLSMTLCEKSLPIILN